MSHKKSRRLTQRSLKRAISGWKLIVTVLFITAIPAYIHALTPEQILDKTRDAIVVVKTFDGKGRFKIQGSGVIISSGKIATSCRILEGGVSYNVYKGKQVVPATIYAEDRDREICILNAKGVTGKPAQFGKTSAIRIGTPLYAVGAPDGLTPSLSDGIVAKLRGGHPPFIQTTAAVYSGSTGGGLFDGEGRLVGLTTLYTESGQNFSFAIPVEWIGETKPGRKIPFGARNRIEWLKKAISLQKFKDWHNLLDHSLSWTKSEPQNAEARYTLGIAHGNLKSYDDAINAFRQAVRINPKHAEAWNNLGDAYRKINRYSDAAECFRRALRIDPKYAEPWNNLGVAYGELQRHDDAVEVLRQALRIDPKYADAWYNLGISYIELKQYSNAIEAFNRSLLINPDDAEAWHNLGVSYGELQLHDDAIDAFRQALRINPKHAKAWYELGVAYALSGNLPAALNSVRELRRLDPERADRLFNQIAPL
ncbi:MAG: serine protease [Desulfobacteraceae bacterium]|nr:MAG: serine protease [Desulfobacteraceae bacterium]